MQMTIEQSLARIAEILEHIEQQLEKVIEK